MVPKRVEDRISKSIGKFQQILRVAKDRDVNETDTVSIVKDMLSEIFGYDKYLEITSEFSIRGTFCDLAIKINSKVEFIIEVKAIGLELKESHLRQALDYCANSGIQWAILTNGISWQLFKIIFEQPINADPICAFDFLTLNTKDEEQLERLYTICKEGLAKDAREEFHEKILTINRFILGALILSDDIISSIRRELRKLSGGIIATQEELLQVLSNEVIKREILEGDDAIKAQARVRKFYGKLARRSKDVSQPGAENQKIEDPQVPESDTGNKPSEGSV